MYIDSSMQHRFIQSLDWYGELFTFTRTIENEYHEKVENYEVITFPGLYHNGSAEHVEMSTLDASMVFDKSTPYILAEWENAKVLLPEDRVTINGKVLRVIECNNIQECNVVGEISLEVIV